MGFEKKNLKKNLPKIQAFMKKKHIFILKKKHLVKKKHLKKKNTFILKKKYILKKKHLLKKFCPNNSASVDIGKSAPAVRLTKVLCPLHVMYQIQSYHLPTYFDITPHTINDGGGVIRFHILYSSFADVM